MVRFFLILMVLRIFPIAALSQVDWENPLTTITLEDGLPSTDINDLVIDREGFLWVATINGLVTYDGQFVDKVEALADIEGSYLDLNYDSIRHQLWIGSYNGLILLDLKSDTYQRYYHPNRGTGYTVYQIELIEDSGYAIIASRLGLFQTELGTDTLNDISPIIDDVLYQDDVYSLFVHPRNSEVWISTDRGNFAYNLGNGELLNINEALSIKPTYPFNEIYHDGIHDRVVLGVGGVLDFKKKYTYILTDLELKTGSTIGSETSSYYNKSIIAKNRNELYLCSSDQHLLINISSPETEVFSSEITFDKEVTPLLNLPGGTWARNNKGLSFYPNKTAVSNHYYTTQQSNWFYIQQSYEFDDEHLFIPVLGGEGAYVYNYLNEKWDVIFPNHEIDRLSKSNIVDVWYHNNQVVWLGKDRAYQIEKGILKRFDEFWFTDFDNNVKIIADGLGGIWNAMPSGLKYYEAFADQPIFIDDASICKDLLGDLDVFLDKNQNKIWVTGLCDHIGYLDLESNRFMTINLPVDIRSKTILDVFPDHEKTWFLGDYGEIFSLPVHFETEKLTVHDLNPLIQQQFMRVKDKMVSTFGFYCSFTMDNEDNFWIITEVGLVKLPSDFKNITLFTENDGIYINDPQMNILAANGIEKLPDGRIAFNIRKGICVFDPTQLQKPETRVQPYLRNILVNNEVLDIVNNTDSKIELSPSENFITFDFSTTSLPIHSDIQFLYKLEGVDEDWKNPNARRSISYSNLAGGNYTFSLQAFQPNQVAVPEAFSLEFNIKKHWYQTHLARAVFILLAGLAGLTFYFLQVRRAVEKEKVKSNYEKKLADLKLAALTAQMNPHFIFNSLNSIDYFIIQNEPRDASKYLNLFSRLIRLILKNSRSNYVTLQDEIDMLKMYLDIEALRFESSFKYEIRVNERLDQEYIRIPPMLIQPYVENALWHGLLQKDGEKILLIDFQHRQEDEYLEIRVIDNGIGRAAAAEKKKTKINRIKNKSFGMNITKEKLDVLYKVKGVRASIDIIDLEQQGLPVGTEIVLKIPIT